MTDPRLEALQAKLTEAELEAVTICFVQGHGIRGAARRLNISPQAVRDRLEGVRRKARSLAVTHTRQDPESGRYRSTGLRPLDDWIAQRDARDVQVDETGRDENRPVPGGTLAGDERRLRGIPVVGRGIGGASPGTRP